MEGAMGVEVKREGRRTYILGAPYGAREQLKAAGAHWDGDRKAWWLGDDAKARALAEQLATAPAEPEGLRDGDILLGRGAYRGRSCLVLWVGDTQGERRCRLASLDGSRAWWAPAEEVGVEKRYQAREHRGRSEPMTWGRLVRLRARLAEAGGDVEQARITAAERAGICRECGGPLVDASHHRAMQGYCGGCAFDEFDG
jgi:hypothetical protein